MIILACDHCGKQSPDKNGLRVADKWLTLTFQTQLERDKGHAARKLILCLDCAPLTINVARLATASTGTD